MGQLLTESVLLSICGGLLGVVLGYLGVRGLLLLNPGDIPRLGEEGSAVTLDWRVLAFTAGISIATGILFGLTPALQASRADLSAAMNQGGSRSGSGLRANQARSLLVVAEVALALVLLIGAALLIGIYGVMAYSVQQRTQEMGIRIALGATPAQVRNMVMLQGMRLALAGVTLGMLVALGLTRVMAGMAYGVKTSDPIAIAVVSLLLSLAALAATYVPSRRAIGVDPVEALRRE